jgi:hypothetical protein
MSHPVLVARLAALHQAESVGRARRWARRREAAVFASMARARAPARVPRHWRWRYA